jgi:hypothetical protein
MHRKRQSTDFLPAHWRCKCIPSCKAFTALAVFVYVFGFASLAAAEQWWVMRDSATAVCLAEEATEQPQFGARWKGPFVDEATALESLCQNLDPADSSKCVAVIPEGQCTKGTNRTLREGPVRQSDRATEAQTFSLKNVFPPREPLSSPPPPEVKSWTWDVGCHCEWDQTCSGDPSFPFPPGFVYCKHSTTETSNTGDGNSNWWMGSTRPDRISVHVECAGSHAFFDRWDLGSEFTWTSAPSTLMPLTNKNRPPAAVWRPAVQRPAAVRVAAGRLPRTVIPSRAAHVLRISTRLSHFVLTQPSDALKGA